MRAYPSTRERIARALNEGAKGGRIVPYTNRASGKQLYRAFVRGRLLKLNAARLVSGMVPVVDLSVEFAEWYDDLERELPLTWPRGMGAV